MLNKYILRFKMPYLYSAFAGKQRLARLCSIFCFALQLKAPSLLM